MKIAVTGASGFIGRHVLAELTSLDIYVTASVRPGTSPNFGPLTPLVIELDIHNPPANSFDLLGRPDALIHLAWDGLPNYWSLHHFEREAPAHYLFVKNLVTAGLKNVVIAGTCLEYGMQSGPLSEEAIPCPSNPYAFAKNNLRCKLEYLRLNQIFNLTWARIFYLYGEGQSEKSLYPLLQHAVARGDKAFDMSGGEQLRDYLPAQEAGKALVALTMQLTNFGIVNICSGQPTSVRTLVESWIKNNGWKIDINLGRYPYPDYEPLAFWGIRDKLNRILDGK